MLKILGSSLIKIVQTVLKIISQAPKVIEHLSEELPEPQKYKVMMLLGTLGADKLSGVEFEKYVCALIELKGGEAEHVGGNNDYGIDVIAKLNGTEYAIQCKNYTGKVRHDAVQQAVTGKDYYDCDEATVITNSNLTNYAKELSDKTVCKVIERGDLENWILDALANKRRELLEKTLEQDIRE